MVQYVIRDVRDNKYFTDISKNWQTWDDLNNTVFIFDKPKQAVQFIKNKFDWNSNLVVSAIYINSETNECKYLKDVYDNEGKVI